MANSNAPSLLAVDIGNTRIKLGHFQPPLEAPLPHPNWVHALAHDWNEDSLAAALPGKPDEYAWTLSSVNRPAALRLSAWLKQHGVADVHELEHSDLDLVVNLQRPDHAGTDRLVNALAANRLRTAGSAAIVISMGTAITVDRVSPEGAFQGGAILPGISVSARALHDFTDLLPLVEITEQPAPLGTSTIDAMRSGVYWGALGAMRELVARLTDDPRQTEVILTGGAAPEFAAALAELCQSPLNFVPHLTIAGVALAAQRLRESEAAR